MESIKRKPVFLQLTLIILTSIAASYTFQHTEIAYQINGLSFYHYIAYASTVFLGYVCFSRYKKYLGLVFSITLSLVAFSPIGQKAIELFPSLVPFLAVLMGTTTVLVAPSSKGRGFFAFLVVLITPAVLAESRIGGPFRLIATVESIGYYALSVVTVIVVGGCFYLRYATLANLNSLKLLSNEGNEEDVNKLNTLSNFVVLLVVLCGSLIALVLMIPALAIADLLRNTAAALPLYVLISAMGAGIAITTVLYIFKRSHE